MKIKVSELKDEKLDYWTGKAAGEDVFIHDCTAGKACSVRDKSKWTNSSNYSPSTNWSQAGPIIEKMKPTNFYYWKDTDEWTCAWGNGAKWKTGKTALNAAMRCFVASKFGEEVEE